MIPNSGSSQATEIVLCHGEMTEAWTRWGRWSERGGVRPDKIADR